MAATIKIKNSSTTGSVPSASNLVQGELAVNVTDLGLYTENASGTVVKLNAPSIDDKNTGATKHLTIDTSGNLGLGVTPSAWSAAYKATQLGTVSAIWGSTGGDHDTNVGSNIYFNGTNNLYITSDYATQYQQYRGKHIWFTAPSGTAGNSITFTQAMTLDASGNLGIGTTSPSNRLHVYGSNVAGRGQLCLQSASAGDEARITFFDGTDSIGEIATAGSNLYLYTGSGGGLLFYANAAERARIDSSGNLLVGTTNSSPIGSGVQGVVALAGGRLDVNRSDAPALHVGRYTGTGSAINFYYAGVAVGSVSVTASTTAYNTSSDYRLKENVQPMQNALATVAQLKPCTYTWKADGSAGQGFIAHELQEVVPDCVTGAKDAVDENGNIKPQGIDTSFLVATLTAAIQELNAKFEAYKAAHP